MHKQHSLKVLLYDRLLHFLKECYKGFFLLSSCWHKVTSRMPQNIHIVKIWQKFLTHLFLNHPVIKSIVINLLLAIIKYLSVSPNTCRVGIETLVWWSSIIALNVFLWSCVLETNPATRTQNLEVINLSTQEIENNNFTWSK